MPAGIPGRSAVSRKGSVPLNSSNSTATRKASPGFTAGQWQEFCANGYIQIPGTMTPGEVSRYREIAEEIARRYPDYDPAHAFRIANVLPQHEGFFDLIDNDRHVGFPYDLYGDQLQLVQSDLFIRPPGGIVNHWHIDGPRALPFRVFSPILPLKLRIGYWLTDVDKPLMGNYVYIPGSHKPEYDGEHSGNGDVPGQVTICGSAGTITVAHANLWHRIDPNESDRTRITIFLTYAPSWIANYYSYPAELLARLNREQRIILRPYTDGEDFIRPPREDLPLFLDSYLPDGPPGTDFHKIRRYTRYERTLRDLT
jgi:phytanoyl-CoA dioxygenase PhyH